MKIWSSMRSTARNTLDGVIRILMRNNTIRNRISAQVRAAEMAGPRGEINAVIVSRFREELRRRLSMGPIDPMRENLAVRNEAGTFQVDNYPISKFLVEELLPVAGHWPYPPPEVHLMVSAVCWIRPNLIIEWGTNVGNSARIFWQTVKKFDIPCRIHSIDLPEDAEHPENVKSDRGILVKGLSDVSLHLGDGLETALRIFSERPSGARCLFFIDGDHAYESVTSELEGIMNSAPEAAILLHDTLSSLKRWPHEALQDALKSRRGMYRVVSTDIGLPGMSFVYPVGTSYCGHPS
jgi:hypothetical protein